MRLWGDMRYDGGVGVLAACCGGAASGENERERVWTMGNGQGFPFGSCLFMHSATYFIGMTKPRCGI